MADKADLPQPEITKDRIVQRKLDANIERLYDQFKEVLNNSSNKNISAQRRKMYQEFVKLVEEMRQL